MKIKNTIIILFSILLIFVSCSKNKGEAEIRAAVNEMHDELIEYEKNMLRAANSKEVADEMIRHYRKMAEIADVFKKLGEKYPELNDEKYMGKYKNEALVEEVDKKVNTVREKYDDEPEVANVWGKILNEIQADSTVSSD